MECQAVSELLPFFLNGTLEAAERERVRAHLDHCPHCRLDLEQARQAMAVFAAHLPSEALVALAWEREPAGFDPHQVKRHLDSCPECASDLALARKSRALEGDPAVLRWRPHVARGAFLRYAGLAAGLIVAVGAGIAYRVVTDGGAKAAVEAENRRLGAQLIDLQGVVERLREEQARLGERLARLDAPQPNVQIVELLSAASTLRGASGSRNETRLSRDTPLVVLLLGARTDRPAAVEIHNASGGLVWRGEGLRPGPLGGYAIGVPSTLLPDGDYSIRLRPSSGGPGESFLLRVSRLP